MKHCVNLADNRMFGQRSAQAFEMEDSEEIVGHSFSEVLGPCAVHVFF